PCPQCGQYQEHMVRALKRDFQLGRWWTAIAFFLIAVTIAAVSSLLSYAGERQAMWVALAIAAFLVAAGVFLLWYRARCLRVYSPNAGDNAARLEIALTYAKSIEGFRAYLQENGIGFHLPSELELRRGLER